MTCPDCAGPVNVPCFYGEKLRCGCGTTIIAAPRAEQAQVMDLQGLLAVLRANRVSRYSAGGVTLVMHPDAWADTPAAAAAAPADIPAEACDCGHEVDAHTDSGCMTASCDPAVCEAWAKKSTSTTATAPVAYTS